MKKPIPRPGSYNAVREAMIQNQKEPPVAAVPSTAKPPRVPRASRKPDPVLEKAPESEVEHAETMNEALYDVESVRATITEFLKKRDERIADLMKWHAEYNALYFEGALSTPLVTVEKLDGRLPPLATYFMEHRGVGIKFHIRFNLAMIALCWNDKHLFRIQDTLKHEMIHQWQHEVLYKGMPKTKSWHNKDFKKKAEEIGIPCIGRNMVTGTNLEAVAAELRGEGTLEELELTEEEVKSVPKKSRNRKWQCGCGKDRTVWSTKEVTAVCAACKKPYTEVQA